MWHGQPLCKIVVIEEPGHPRLTRAAIDAVRRASFEPARAAAGPVRNEIEVPIRFVLR